MSSIHDGKTRPGRKARILLLFSIVTCALAISAAFHNCYVVDGYHPGLPPNVYPSINYERINPNIYYDAEMSTTKDLSNFCKDDIMVFSIGEIFDPDEEPVMYGRYAINYEGPQSAGTTRGDRFQVTRSEIEDEKTGQMIESSTIWEGSVNIQFEEFSPAGTYEVLAAISDRRWMEATSTERGYFGVPDDTQAAFVKWVIVTTGTLKADGCP